MFINYVVITYEPITDAMAEGHLSGFTITVTTSIAEKEKINEE